MTQKDKKLLLQDLCCRLPYRVIVKVHDTEHGDFDSYIENISRTCVETHAIEDLDYNPYVFYRLEDIKPYLRPMSSMTDDEQNELDYLRFRHDEEGWLDFVLSRHLDWRGLIPMNLALEAPEGMYNLKENYGK